MDLKELNYVRDIKSEYIQQGIFEYLNEKQKISLIIYNKRIQNIFRIDIKDYKNMSGKIRIIEKNGKGREYTLYKELRFEGEYINGKRNGKGKEYYFDDKLKYDGEYINGERNGKGKEYCKNGELKFEGEYLNGKLWKAICYNIKGDLVSEIKEGKGKLKEYDYLGRLRFEVEYLNGKRNGKGKNYYANGGLEFEG